MVFLDFWYKNNIVRIPFSGGVFFFSYPIIRIPKYLGSKVRNPFFQTCSKIVLFIRFRQTNSYDSLRQNPIMGHFGIFPVVTGIQLVIVSVRHSCHMSELPILGREDSLTPDGDTSSVEPHSGS